MGTRPVTLAHSTNIETLAHTWQENARSRKGKSSAVTTRHVRLNSHNKDTLGQYVKGVYMRGYASSNVTALCTKRN